MTATVAAFRTSRSAPAAVPGRLVLLATGPAGYRSLCRLSSLIQAHPEREVLADRGLTWTDLEAHREGLICLSGGRMGWIERLPAGQGSSKPPAPTPPTWPKSMATGPISAWNCTSLSDLAVARELIATRPAVWTRPAPPSSRSTA